MKMPLAMQYLEEAFADVYAGIHRGGVNTARAKQIMEIQTTELQRAAQNRRAMQNKNAPPEQRYGYKTRYSFAEQKIPTYEELIAKPDIAVIDIRNENSGNAKEQRAAFVKSEEMRKICKTPVTNKDTGEMVFITHDTFTHTFSNIGIDQIAAAKKIREIVENAVLTHAEPSRKDAADHTTGVYTLFAAVKNETGIFPVKIKLKEYRVEEQDIPAEVRNYISGNGMTLDVFSKVYDSRVLVIEEIKREEVSSSAITISPGKPDEVNHPSTSSKISIAKLISLVKGDAAKYLPKPKIKQKFSIDEEYFAAVEDGDMETAQRMVMQAAKRAMPKSKAVDENGDLLYMYHGTSHGGFTVFDPYSSNFGLFGYGSYFTDNSEVTESYTTKGRGDSKQVYKVFLNIVNPIDMDAPANMDG